MKQTILVFSGVAIAIFLIYQLSKYSLYFAPGSQKYLLFLAAILFIAVGFVIKSMFAKKNIAETTENIDPIAARKKANLTKQEYKILLLLAEGLSNAEIAAELFVQESTVKSHVSNIFSKLDAKRRTEAVKIARSNQII